MISLIDGIDADYKNGWFRKGNITFFIDGWQLPAKTELDALESLISNPETNHRVQYLLFPWASLVDCFVTGNVKKASYFIRALNCCPPKVSPSLVTYCQHIYSFKLIDYFEMLGITKLYWSHKVVQQDYINKIRILPYKLYPVMYEKYKSTIRPKSLFERRYLYSFIGSYQKDCYLSDIRRFIFNLPESEVSKIVERDGWHFESDVYDFQMRGIEPDAQLLLNKTANELEYVECLSNTVFSLCPSGSGPNSIRIWESLMLGCVPVVFSNDLDLPAEYSKRVVHLEETENSLKVFINSVNNYSVEEVFDIYGVDFEE